jgi:hypothetical protein
MKKCFWYSAILNDKDAHTATLWGCFGYLWIGGGMMLEALLNSAGWVKTGVDPVSGIVIGMYAAIFGSLTWKQSFVGTIVGFILYGILIATLEFFTIQDGNYAEAIRGSWVVLGQSVLLLNGVRAARYKRHTNVGSANAPAPESNAGSVSKLRL